MPPTGAESLAGARAEITEPGRRVLVVAYYFPPIGGIGSIRMAGFVNELPTLGWEPTVIAPARTPHPVDPTLFVEARRVVRTHSIEPSRLKRVVPGAGDGAAAHGKPRLRAKARN